MHPAIWELWLIKTAHLRKAVSPEGLRYASKALQDRMQNEAEFADPEVMATFKREHRGMTPLQWAFAHFPELAREVAKEFPWMVPPEPPSEP